MDVEKHIMDLQSEIESLIMAEIKIRYKKGIAYLCFSELSELRVLWRSEDYLGGESIFRAFTKAMYSPTISEYVDGLAVGDNMSSGNMIRRGLFWNFKQEFQIFDNNFEFGPEPCKHLMVTDFERDSLILQLQNSSVMGSFIFGAMKYIAIYKSLAKKHLFLADEQYFRLFDEMPEFLFDAVRILNALLTEQKITSQVIPVRGNWLNTKPKLQANMDIEISWPEIKV